MADKLCNECQKRKVTEGASPDARTARMLGLCLQCLKAPGVRAKWRKKLCIPRKTRQGKPPATAGPQSDEASGIASIFRELAHLLWIAGRP